jgi:ATP-dependent RNA helicase RhlE
LVTGASSAPETNTASQFAVLGLIAPLLAALAEQGHEIPTPIQARAIPPALAGRDVLGCAQTGTGKTAAFALPILQRFASAPKSGAGIRALVLSPTRELAAQIGDSFSRYGRFCTTRHAVVFGGVGQGAQVRELQRGIDVLVATPGRLEDLVGQGYVDLSRVEVLVLDEVDRMLDQGFWPAVKRLVARIPKARQTLLFSATLPPELRGFARELQRDPAEVSAAPIASTPDAIEQAVYHVAPTDKRPLLEELLRDQGLTRAIVFTRTKHGADRVARHLNSASLAAQALHGGKSQGARERALSAFKDGQLRVLVATDLAARGIHVDDISHVINFDLPVDAESYVHRIGRTARAGSSGKALSLCSPEESDALRRIERLIRRPLPVRTAVFSAARPVAPRPAAERLSATSSARVTSAAATPTGRSVYRGGPSRGSRRREVS